MASSSAAAADIGSGRGADGGDDLGQRRFRRWFWLIVAVAGVWRGFYVAMAKVGEPLVGDQIYYSGQAVVIADGRWFEHPFFGGYAADHVPLTSLIIAPVSWLDSYVVMSQRFVMALLGTAVVAGVGVLARLIATRRVALIATAIAAVSANFWMNDGLLMAETPAAAGVVAVLVAAYWYRWQPGARVAVLAGVAVGVAALARAELLLLGPVLVAPLIFFTRREGATVSRRVGHVAVAGVMAALVIAPWVIRNQVRFEESTIMSTQDGLTLLGTNCPEAYYGDGIGFWILSCADRVEVPAGADQSVVSSLYREAAVDYARSELDRLPTVVTARLGRGLSVWRIDAMVNLNVGEGRETWASRIGLWQWWLLAPLALFGAIRWRSWAPRWPLVVCIGLSVALIAALYGIPRFRIAGEVSVVVFAAMAIDQLAARFSSSRSQATS